MINKVITTESPVALVTGAGSGIGLAVVEKLLSQKYIVYACTGSKTDHLKKLRNTLEEGNKKSFYIKKFDINDSQLTTQIVQEIYKTSKRIDVLVNSAGIPYGNLFLLTKSSEMKEVFEINFFSLLSFTQLISRVMSRNKRGSIVNISSATSFRADAGTLAYGSAKAALNYATKVLAKELASQGVRVNAVAPGVTNTAMLERMDPNAIKEQLESSSLKKIASPCQIASVIMFLCSMESSHITGQIIRVDGGQ